MQAAYTEKTSTRQASGQPRARAASPAHRPLSASARLQLTLAGVLAFLLLWAGLSWWKASPLQLPAPWSVASALRELAADGDLWANAGISVQRVLLSLVISALLAVPLGLLMGLSRRAEQLVDPLVEILRPISGIAWIPLALFIFGVGDALPIFILVYVATFQLLLATVAGVKSVDSKLMSAARIMGISQRAIVLHVVLPAALPHLMAGLRLAFAASWSAIVAAELIGAPSGVGFAIEWYRQLLMTPKVFAFIAVIGLIGYVSDLTLRALQEQLAPADRQLPSSSGAAPAVQRNGGGFQRIAGLCNSLLLPALLVAAWQIWTLTLPAQSQAPSPLRVVEAFLALTSSGQLPAALVQSLGRVGVGFAIALALAVPIGIVMGRSAIVQGLLNPIVEGFRPIAPMAILPIAILWLGTGTPTAYAIVAYAAFFPILINTVASVARLDRRLLRAADTMGIRRWPLLLRIVLPGALPNILLGARIGMGVAWTAIIAAELAVGSASGGGSSGGIGQMMFVFYSYSVDLNGIVVCMIVVGVVALLIDRLFRIAEKRLMPWRFTHVR